jgi:hypothetical protein
MTLRAFELSSIGGPWARRIAPRRAWLDELPWDEPLPQDALGARAVWTRTAFSEYASAAAFAEIAAALAAAGAPLELLAAAGDFVVDEVVHAEAAARVAAALGGAVALEVDFTRLCRPASAGDPLLRAAELLVRTSCIGETLTVPILKLARSLAGAVLVEETLARVVHDEAAHCQLGWWFLDWAEPRLDDGARAHLGRVAGAALLAFAPLLGGGCTRSGLGAVACDRYDPALLAAAHHQIVLPMAARGIDVDREVLATLRRAVASSEPSDAPSGAARLGGHRSAATTGGAEGPALAHRPPSDRAEATAEPTPGAPVAIRDALAGGA